MINGQRVFITGGCGHLGSSLVRELLNEHDPERIDVFDNSEQSLFELKQEFEQFKSQIQPVFGDVRQLDRLNELMDDVDVVIHTAGLKHVGLCEYHPIEAMRTNCIGTWHVIQAAVRNNVDEVIGISTDKAVNPSSVMGATKMMAERLLTAADHRAPEDGPHFGSVRLGNVFASHGSVVPIFMDQITSGGPVTITDREMTRFVISTDDAAAFVITSLQELSGGEVFIPKLPAFRVIDLAEAMVREYAPNTLNPEQINVETVGRRPGERLHELLISRTEIPYVTERDDRFVLMPQIDMEGGAKWRVPSEHSLSEPYSSGTAEFLSQGQLIERIEYERPFQESGYKRPNPAVRD